MGTFNYNKSAFGGTEYMGRGWHKHLAPYLPKFGKYQSLIIPGVTPHPEDILNSDKQIIVWMHNTLAQFDDDKADTIRDFRFLDKVKYFIVPTEEHKRITLSEVSIEPERIYVIPNAIEPLKYNPEKFNNVSKVKVIHTSSMDRGLDILLNAMTIMDSDFTIEVYNNFYPDIYEQELPIDSKVKLYGKTPRMTVRQALEEAHIHAYPSTYPETFCLSQIEALSAGLLCVTSDFGALPEVSGGYGRQYPYVEDRAEHMKIFAEQLAIAVDDIKSNRFDPGAQIEYVNNKYSWKAVKEKWLEFHELL